MCKISIIIVGPCDNMTIVNCFFKGVKQCLWFISCKVYSHLRKFELGNVINIPLCQPI